VTDIIKAPSPTVTDIIKGPSPTVTDIVLNGLYLADKGKNIPEIFLKNNKINISVL
jgi:hypothetical protein